MEEVDSLVMRNKSWQKFTNKVNFSATKTRFGFDSIWYTRDNITSTRTSYLPLRIYNALIYQITYSESHNGETENVLCLIIFYVTPEIKSPVEP